MSVMGPDLSGLSQHRSPLVCCLPTSGTRMTGLFFQVFFDLTVMLQGFSAARVGQA